MAKVPKKPKLALSLQNARGILCSPEPAKLLGRTLRAQAAPALAAEVDALQFGAVPGGGVEIPSAAVRFLTTYAAATSQPLALLFVDVKAAFYSCLVETVLGKLLTPAGRCAALSQIGFSGADCVDRAHGAP